MQSRLLIRGVQESEAAASSLKSMHGESQRQTGRQMERKESILTNQSFQHLTHIYGQYLSLTDGMSTENGQAMMHILISQTDVMESRSKLQLNHSVLITLNVSGGGGSFIFQNDFSLLQSCRQQIRHLFPGASKRDNNLGWKCSRLYGRRKPC